jgi:hypothetical protein
MLSDFFEYNCLLKYMVLPNFPSKSTCEFVISGRIILKTKGIYEISNKQKHMSTFKAFNAMLSEFLGDLAETFDEYKAVSDANAMLAGLLAVNDSTDAPMKTFIGVFTPHKELLMAKDKRLFDVCKIPLVDQSGFDIAKEWSSLEGDNQEAIWGYLHQLFAIGSTIMGLSPELLSSIEGVAQGCMEKVSRGEMTEEDAKNPMVIVQEIMQNKELMAAFGGSGFSGFDAGSDAGAGNPMDMIKQMMGNQS